VVSEPGLNAEGLDPSGQSASGPDGSGALAHQDPWSQPPVEPLFLQPSGFGRPGGYPPPAAPVALPVEPREYHQFYRAPAFHWWKPLVALGMLGSVTFIVAVIAGIGYVVVLVLNGVPFSAIAEMDLASPGMFALNNVLLALLIPVSLLTSWAVFRQRPRWLSSVAGGFRWQAFWRFFGIAAAALAAALAIEGQLTGGFGELSWGPDSLFLLLVIVFTTPFQAAGEEYAFRGVLNRGVGSWFSNRWTGLVVGGLVNSAAFMVMHGAGDMWLNAYYLLVGVTFSVLVWRTGGLEAAVAFHIANNLVSEALMPFSPGALAEAFNRQAGVAGPEMLIQIGVMALVAGLLLWQSSRLGLGRSNAPGALPLQQR
jgi:uncharacterized protein